MVDRSIRVEQLDEDIYDPALVSRYKKYTSRIKNFKARDEFDTFVVGALNILAEATPARLHDALPVEYLVDILSYFPSCDELLALRDYRKRLGIAVTTLIRSLEMHGHLRHRETILTLWSCLKKWAKMSVKIQVYYSYTSLECAISPESVCGAVEKGLRIEQAFVLVLKSPSSIQTLTHLICCSAIIWIDP